MVKPRGWWKGPQKSDSRGFFRSFGAWSSVGWLLTTCVVGCVLSPLRGNAEGTLLWGGAEAHFRCCAQVRLSATRSAWLSRLPSEGSSTKVI